MQPKLKIQWYHREMIKLVGYMRIRSMREIHASCYPGARYKYYITFTLINLNHIDHADTKNHGADRELYNYRKTEDSFVCWSYRFVYTPSSIYHQLIVELIKHPTILTIYSELKHKHNKLVDVWGTYIPWIGRSLDRLLAVLPPCPEIRRNHLPGCSPPCRCRRWNAYHLPCLVLPAHMNL